MHRPHRGIETFDISLMAVVTKAMGAFLVMMLLLMPYYSSGPIGQQAATDLSAKVDQIDQQIKKVMDQLTTASPADLQKLLEDALKMLDEARQLISELKRDNDALQAQVKRLEDQTATLQAQVSSLQSQIASMQAQMQQLQSDNASLQAQNTSLQQDNDKLKSELGKYSGDSVTAVLTQVNCPQTLSIYLLQDGDHVTVTKTSKTLTNVFNFGGPTRSDFTNSAFSFVVRGDLSPAQGQPEKVRLVVMASKDREYTMLKSGSSGLRLKRVAADCKFSVGVHGDGDKLNYTFDMVDEQINQGDYGLFLGVIEVDTDGLKWGDPSPVDNAWYNDQLKNAEKED